MESFYFVLSIVSLLAVKHFDERSICGSTAHKDEDDELIKRIHAYWFHGNLKDQYRSKWFPSSDIQRRADEEISQTFSATLTRALNGDFDSWRCRSLKASIALVIVLDQFSRHIFRFNNVPPGASEREEADSQALAVAEKIFDTIGLLTDKSDRCGLSVGWDMNLTVVEFVFSLMPFRHSPTLERLRLVLEEIDRRYAAESDQIDILKKFRKQTVRRLENLEDRAKAEETDDILERDAFTADESDIFLNPLVIATDLFLQRRYQNWTGGVSGRVTLFLSLSGGVDSMVISKILAVLQAKRSRGSEPENSQRQSKSSSDVGGYEIDEIVALHINYNNRPESSREAAYVKSWCQGSLEANSNSDCSTNGGMRNGGLRITFHERVITEATRGVTDRTDYEKITRQIRYDFYKDVINQYTTATATTDSSSGSSSSGSSSSGSCSSGSSSSGSSITADHSTRVLDQLSTGVIFGHHQGLSVCLSVCLFVCLSVSYTVRK